MEWKVHEDAKQEFKQLPEKVGEALKQEIKSRKNREKTILKQRGVGTSYDNHGEPVNYFKMVNEREKIDYRIFFDIQESEIVMLGIRKRDNDTYVNLRDYSRLVER